MFLLLVAVVARADDIAVALTCPAALEPELLRPYTRVTGEEFADAWLALVTDSYEPEDCGCPDWEECTAVNCVLPDGSLLDLETHEEWGTVWDGAGGCDILTSISVRRLLLQAPGGEPGVTLLEGERVIWYEEGSCAEAFIDIQTHYVRWEDGTRERFGGDGLLEFDERSRWPSGLLERDGEACSWTVDWAENRAEPWDYGTAVTTDAGTVAVYEGPCGSSYLAAVVNGVEPPTPVDSASWAWLGADRDGDLFADVEDPYPDDPLRGPCEPSDFDGDHDDDGYAGLEDDGPDCNDDDPSINPYAAEQLCDGVDQDCDGLDNTDADHDGYDALACGGTDCDDGNVEVHPDRLDVPDDGVDADCEGGDAHREDPFGCAATPGLAVIGLGVVRAAMRRRPRA